MNYSMGSGIIRYIRASKTFSKFHAFRSSVRFEVPCVSKFSALRSSVCFEVPCASKFRVGTKINILIPMGKLDNNYTVLERSITIFSNHYQHL